MIAAASEMRVPDRPIVCLRMDDVGASSKYFERHGHTRLHFGGVAVPFPGNFWFLKSIPPFRRWGPYREMSVPEWEATLSILSSSGARMTVAVTASWVEEDGRLTPFDEKFPEQRRVIREGVEAGLIEIANHGLTHCVVEEGKFRVGFWRDNRNFHREFWDWVPAAIRKDHLDRSQDILERSFGQRPTTFVPPGNVHTPDTLEFARAAGLRWLSCSRPPVTESPALTYVSDSELLAFHDRELVLYGLSWLKDRLAQAGERPFQFVRELAAR